MPPTSEAFLFFDKSIYYLKNYTCHMAKDGLMHIFQDELKRLTADLEIEFRGMKISPIVTKSNEIDITFLNDFLFIITWLKQHSEVKYVHFELDVKALNNPHFENSNELQTFRIKLLELQREMNTCASTFFFSGSGKFSLFWAEFLSLFDDVTLIENSEVIFNHTSKGLITILDTSLIMKNLGVKKSFLTIPRPLNFAQTNIEVMSTNDRSSKIKNLKKIIFGQSELSKIQMRASVNQENDHQTLFNGNLQSNDWLNKSEKFQKLRDLKDSLQNEHRDLGFLN